MHPISFPTTKITFGSANCPVKPFTVETELGPLDVEEVKDHKKAAAFEVESNVESFDCWKRIANNKDEQKRAMNWIEGENKKLLEHDSNATILVAKDQKGDVRGFFSMRSFDDIYVFAPKSLYDKNVGYVEECMMDSKFRGKGVGEKILAKLLETGNGQFKGILLDASKKAETFYKKFGFEPLDTSKEPVELISFLMSRARNDSNSVTIMSKSLDSTTPWWQKISSQLANDYDKIMAVWTRLGKTLPPK